MPCHKRVTVKRAIGLKARCIRKKACGAPKNLARSRGAAASGRQTYYYLPPKGGRRQMHAKAAVGLAHRGPARTHGILGRSKSKPPGKPSPTVLIEWYAKSLRVSSHSDPRCAPRPGQSQESFEGARRPAEDRSDASWRRGSSLSGGYGWPNRLRLISRHFRTPGDVRAGCIDSAIC